MMRLKHGLTPVLGAFAMLAAVTTAGAQSGRSDRGDSGPLPFAAPGTAFVEPLTDVDTDDAPLFRANNAYGPPMSAYGPPPGGPVPGGYNAVPYDVPGYTGVPDGSNPWPAISPFESRFEEHTWMDGVWMRVTNNGRRKFFAGIQAMLFQLHKPQAKLFGDPSASKLQGPNPFGRDVIYTGSRAPWGERIFDEPFKTEGMRLNWGFWDPDDTGAEVVGWWASDVFEDFFMFPNFDPANPPAYNPRGVVVPTNNGTPAGTIMFFDGNFRIRYQQVAANAQFSRMLRPMWSWRDAVKLRPMWGFRYTYIHERMIFSGHDFFPPTPPYRTDLTSKTTSNLFGPEIGLHTTIGSDAFRFILGTRFILYVNLDEQQLAGNNMIDLDSLPLAAGVNLGFSHRRHTGHVSPAFEQTVHAELKVFQFIPIINRIDVLKNGKIRGGLTFLDIGEIVRPNQQIKFNSFPLFPILQTRRSKYSLLAWDVGLQFDY